MKRRILRAVTESAIWLAVGAVFAAFLSWLYDVPAPA